MLVSWPHVGMKEAVGSDRHAQLKAPIISPQCNTSTEHCGRAWSGPT